MPEEVVEKALSVETRVDLLNELGKHGKTPTYLADAVGKHKSTVVEHLAILQDAGLVERRSQEGQKRVTYTLTRHGQKVTASSRRAAVLVGSAGAAVTGAGAILSTHLQKPMGTAARQAEALTMQAPEAAEAAETAAGIDPLLVGGVVLLLLGTVGLGYWYRTR